MNVMMGRGKYEGWKNVQWILVWTRMAMRKWREWVERAFEEKRVHDVV